jgi:hypothetical protein
MKVPMSLGIVITLSLIGGSVEAKAAGCEAIGNVRFICDQLGPEDLAAVPGSDWVLASGMAANGAIRLMSTPSPLMLVAAHAAALSKAKKHPQGPASPCCGGTIP